MAGILDGIVNGLAKLAPQDDPDVRIFNAQNELKALAEKENSVYAELGKRAFEDGGAENYPDFAVRLEAISAERANVEKRIAELKEEKAAIEKAEAEAEAARQAAEASRTCGNCGTLNADGCKFCCNCGTKLPEEVPLPSPKLFCTSCGYALENGMKFCSRCGAKQN